MATKEIVVLDLSDLNTKRDLSKRIALMQGLWEISFKERKRVRSLSANNYYHGAIVEGFRKAVERFNKEQGDNEWTHLECHEFLKDKFLAKSVTIRGSGGSFEEIKKPSTTTNKDDQEFFDYCTKCRIWIEEFFNFTIDDRSLY